MRTVIVEASYLLPQWIGVPKPFFAPSRRFARGDSSATVHRMPGRDAGRQGAGLVSSGLLTDDNRQGVEFAPVTYSRDPKSWGSRITLEEREAKQCGR